MYTLKQYRDLLWARVEEVATERKDLESAVLSLYAAVQEIKHPMDRHGKEKEYWDKNVELAALGEEEDEIQTLLLHLEAADGYLPADLRAKLEQYVPKPPSPGSKPLSKRKLRLLELQQRLARDPRHVDAVMSDIVPPLKRFGRPEGEVRDSIGFAAPVRIKHGSSEPYGPRKRR